MSQLPNHNTAPNLITTKIIPTLFIALGGTGLEIAWRIRLRILSHVWGSDASPLHIDNLSEFPLAQFIHYDLDSISEYRTSGDPANFSDGEKMTFKLDIDKYLRTDDELKRYPLIASWFPLTRKDCPGFFAPYGEWGPLQIRSLSRLNFFDKYQHLKTMIEGKIRSLLRDISNRLDLEKLGLAMEPASLRVVVIASTSGGTGSGSFLDMGYLASWLAKKEITGAKIDLCLLLPGGYSGYGKSRSEANTYATLMELETCMEQEGQLVRGWRDGEYPELPTKPYDDVFLVDNTNLVQKTVKAADLFNMVANLLFEDFASPVIAERRRASRAVKLQYRLNPFDLPVDSQKYGSMKISYSGAYSTFGRSVIDLQMLQQRDEVAFRQDTNTAIFKVLEEMSSTERSSLFQNCLEMAMPWVDADVEGLWSVNPDQYTCIIGVDDADLFNKRFGDEFRSVVPSITRMNSCQVKFIETGVSGRLTCYVELSGIPLTALKQLPKWRESYDYENKKIPVHIHRDKALFVHPLAPSAGELDSLAEHFKLYIEGIIYGSLKLRKEAPNKRLYCITVSGDEPSIGNERNIRSEGIAPEYLGFLKKKISDMRDHIKSPMQLAGMAVLFDFYAKGVYPPAIIKNEQIEEFLVYGFCNILCNILSKEALQTLKKKAAAAGLDANDLITCLKGPGDPENWENLKILDIWTNEIEGSETDVFENEVGKSHRPKRVLKPEFFQPGWLEKSMSCNGGGESPKEWWIALDGQKNGPHNEKGLNDLITTGRIGLDTKVWKKGMSGWLPASQVAELVCLFEGPPPIDC